MSPRGSSEVSVCPAIFTCAMSFVLKFLATMPSSEWPTSS